MSRALANRWLLITLLAVLCLVQGRAEILKVHVKDRAGAWKYPRWIDVRPDLPRTATGKIQRFKLRELESQEP